MDKVCSEIDPRLYNVEITPNLRHPQREVRWGFGTTPTGRRENYRVKLRQSEQGKTEVVRVEDLRKTISLLRFIKNCAIRDMESGMIKSLCVDRESLLFILFKLRILGNHWLAEYAKCAIQLCLMEQPTNRSVDVKKIPNHTRKKQRLTRLQRRAKRQKR